MNEGAVVGRERKKKEKLLVLFFFAFLNERSLNRHLKISWEVNQLFCKKKKRIVHIFFDPISMCVCV